MLWPQQTINAYAVFSRHDESVWFVKRAISLLSGSGSDQQHLQFSAQKTLPNPKHQDIFIKPSHNAQKPLAFNLSSHLKPLHKPDDSVKIKIQTLHTNNHQNKIAPAYAKPIKLVEIDSFEKAFPDSYIQFSGFPGRARDSGFAHWR